MVIVRAYLYVFLEKLSILQPPRDIEFTIDLVPGAEPRTTYQKAPLELKKLKE
jgi:hypothetical protein